jgi:hypothetical protein
MTRHAIVVALAVASAAAGRPADAQVVTGRVVESVSNRPLRDVSVMLLSAEGRVLVRSVSDSSGLFWMRAPRFGAFRLTAEHIGMVPVTTEPLALSEGATEVVLRMAETAVPLDPLTVEARGRAADLGPLRGYYERMLWNQRAGVGRFITRDEIEARGPGNISDMLREVPRLSVTRARGTGPFVTVRGGGRGGECTPALFVDGTRVNRRDRAYVDELVRPHDVEGIEIYTGLAQMPGIYHDENNCGVLLIWTRRSPDGGAPMTFRRALAGVGLLALILLLTR